MLIARDFKFDSAHFLTEYYGKCENLHGHSYKLRVTIKGEVQSNGMVIDFVVLKHIVKKHVLDKLDHKLLNDIVENPSAERVIIWIWRQLEDLSALLREEMDDLNIGEELRGYLEDAENINLKDFSDKICLHELKLWETEDSFVTYTGEL